MEKVILGWADSLSSKAFVYSNGLHCGLLLGGSEKTLSSNRADDTVGSIGKYCLNRIFVIN